MGIPTNLDELTAGQKEEMIASLAVLLVGSAGEPEMSSEKLQAVATAAGCSLPAPLASLFASVASKTKVKESYCMGPGGGGGGGGGGGAAAAAAAPEAEPEEEEEAEIGGGGIDSKWQLLWLCCFYFMPWGIDSHAIEPFLDHSQCLAQLKVVAVNTNQQQILKLFLVSLPAYSPISILLLQYLIILRLRWSIYNLIR